jgi:SM-20-related protein
MAMPGYASPSDPRTATSTYEAAALDLATTGWSLTDDFIPPSLTSRLADETRALWNRDAFRPAGTGRADGFQVDPQVRSDRLKWLDPGACTEAQRAYLEHLEKLRLTLNGTLFLGLFELEVHLSVYPPGSFYRRHLDQFRGNNLRTVTTILYLNADWTGADGGQLRLFTDPANGEGYQEILPLAGRLVCFLSDRFPHEVLPTQRDRLSITGWFKQRGAAGR